MPDLIARLEKMLGEATGISIDPEIMHGQPCITGTRIPVHCILRAMAEYGSIGEAYPQLTPQQVKDALWFAQKVLEELGSGE